MYINIGGLNANLDMLKVFIEGLESKPRINVCSETRILQYAKYFDIKSYKLYYNNININICNEVVIYIYGIYSKVLK